MAKDVVTFEWSFLAQVPINEINEVQSLHVALTHHIDHLVNLNEWPTLTFYNGKMVAKNEEDFVDKEKFDCYECSVFVEIPANETKEIDSFKRAADHQLEWLIDMDGWYKWEFWDSHLTELK